MPTKARILKTPSPSSTTTPKPWSAAKPWPSTCASPWPFGTASRAGVSIPSAQLRCTTGPGTAPPTPCSAPKTPCARPLSSSPSSVRRSTAGTTATSRPKARPSKKATTASTTSWGWPSNCKPTRASACCGARPIVSHTRALRTGPPPIQTPTSSPGLRRRSRRPWNAPIGSEELTTCFGVDAKGTPAYSTPTWPTSRINSRASCTWPSNTKRQSALPAPCSWSPSPKSRPSTSTTTTPPPS